MASPVDVALASGALGDTDDDFDVDDADLNTLLTFFGQRGLSPIQFPWHAAWRP